MIISIKKKMALIADGFPVPCIYMLDFGVSEVMWFEGNIELT